MISTGMRIRKIRKMRGLTQKALASKAGIPEITIQCYELETRHPKPEQLSKIAKALDVDIAFLLPQEADSYMAIMFDLIEKYGDIVFENKGETVFFGIDFSRNEQGNLQLAEAKTAHERLPVEEFKKWLIDYKMGANI